MPNPLALGEIHARKAEIIMAQKAPIYTERNIIDHSELLSQLNEAVSELEQKMKTSLPIQKSGDRIGFGVDKAQRGIAADSVISIAKAIKALKGW